MHYLIAQLFAYGREQAILRNFRKRLHGPVFQSGDNCREIRQVGKRAHPKGQKHLTRTQLPDPHAHNISSTSTSVTSATSGASPMPALSAPSICSSCRIRLTVGSTSRSEFRQVNVSHFPRPGLLSNPS